MGGIGLSSDKRGVLTIVIATTAEVKCTSCPSKICLALSLCQSFLKAITGLGTRNLCVAKVPVVQAWTLLPGSLVIFLEPGSCLADGVGQGCELEVWQVGAQFGIGCRLLVLAVRFCLVKHNLTLPSNKHPLSAVVTCSP